MNNFKFFKLMFLSIPLLFIACGDDEPEMEDPMQEPARIITIAPSANAADEAQTAFISVETNFTIEFEEGEFSFVNTLSMDSKDSIIIKGSGRDKTFLDFSAQTSGGEGLLISDCNFIRFEDITIRDSKGDALKARDCNKISFVNVGTIWSGEPDADNGAYGLYPVLCTEVFIDNCYAYGASDAGIYVGQSDQVIVKNSVAEGNVAGIEIENTTNADVFDNEAFDNTGGILVFDLPGLTKNGNSTRVFNNNMRDNNRTNFAPPGNIVGSVPAGTGAMILSTKNVEIFDNTITNNNVAGVIVANYLLIEQNITDPTYDPFPSGINIHDNTMSIGTMVNPVQPELIGGVLLVLQLNGLANPDILSDGLLMSPEALCITQGDATFVNINAGDPTFMSVITDVTAHNCTQDPLPAIAFDPF